jgi:hypothetical protein
MHFGPPPPPLCFPVNLLIGSTTGPLSHLLLGQLLQNLLGLPLRAPVSSELDAELLDGRWTTAETQRGECMHDVAVWCWCSASVGLSSRHSDRR